MQNKRLFLAGLVALTVLSFTGCASNPGGAQFDSRGAALLGKSTLRTTTKLVLDNNPDLLPAITAVNSGVAVLFSGGLTVEAIAAQLIVHVPGLPADDVGLLAANLADAVEYYRIKSGKEGPTLNLASPDVQALILALTQGINEGIALHKQGKG